MLHALPSELQGKASRPPPAGLLAPKSQFKMVLIREHYPLPILHSLAHMLPSKCQPLPLSSTWLGGTVGIFPGRKLEVPHAAVLDPQILTETRVGMLLLVRLQ
jgi:hypothetical protein